MDTTTALDTIAAAHKWQLVFRNIEAEYYYVSELYVCSKCGMRQRRTLGPDSEWRVTMFTPDVMAVSIETAARLRCKA